MRVELAGKAESAVKTRFVAMAELAGRRSPFRKLAARSEFAAKAETDVKAESTARADLAGKKKLTLKAKSGLDAGSCAAGPILADKSSLGDGSNAAFSGFAGGPSLAAVIEMPALQQVRLCTKAPLFQAVVGDPAREETKLLQNRSGMVGKHTSPGRSWPDALPVMLMPARSSSRARSWYHRCTSSNAVRSWLGWFLSCSWLECDWFHAGHGTLCCSCCERRSGQNHSVGRHGENDIGRYS